MGGRANCYLFKRSHVLIADVATWVPNLTISTCYLIILMMSLPYMCKMWPVCKMRPVVDTLLSVK
jgi:hypothetical protein